MFIQPIDITNDPDKSAKTFFVSSAQARETCMDKGPGQNAGHDTAQKKREKSLKSDISDISSDRQLYQ